MNDFLDILWFILGCCVLWECYHGIHAFISWSRQRRGGQVKNIRRYEDYEMLAHADWLATGHDAWKKEQERKR